MNVTPSSPVAHCPLCIPGMVEPPDDHRPAALIFLDMDGVMINGRGYDPLRKEIVSTLKSLFPQTYYDDYDWAVSKGRHLNPLALTNLHTLIERVEKAGHRALVVISSGWRNDATTLQLRDEVFSQHKFAKHIVGKTPPGYSDVRWTPECKAGHDFLKPALEKYGLKLRTRAEEVEHWLLEHKFDPKTSNFVVIDDCDEGLSDRFGSRFIRTWDVIREYHLEAATNALLPSHPATLSDDG